MAAVLAEDDVFMNELEMLVSCSICMTFLENPKSLLCGHSFCAACLKDWHGSSKVSEKDTTVIQCPECRDITKLPSVGIDGLSTNYRINQILGAIQAQQAKQMENDQAAKVQPPKSRRERNESVYGSWRKHFSSFCQNELEKAAGSIQTKLNDIDAKEEMLHQAKQAYETAENKAAKDINDTVAEVMQASERARNIMLSELKEAKQEYLSHHEQQVEILNLEHKEHSESLQMITDVLECPTRERITFYQENEALLVEVAKLKETDNEIAPEIHSMVVFQKSQKDCPIGGLFGTLSTTMLQEESRGAHPPATNPYLDSSAHDFIVSAPGLHAPAPDPNASAPFIRASAPGSSSELHPEAVHCTPPIPRHQEPTTPAQPGRPRQHLFTRNQLDHSTQPNTAMRARLGGPHPVCSPPLPPRNPVLTDTSRLLSASAPNLHAMTEGTDSVDKRPLPKVPPRIRASLPPLGVPGSPPVRKKPRNQKQEKCTIV